MKLLLLIVFIIGSMLGSNVARAQTGQPAQNEWNKIVEAAKKEGKVVVSVPASAGTRRLNVDTQWLKEFGIIAAKDSLTPDQYPNLENQSEEKVVKVREPAAEFARKLLDSKE